MTADLPEAASRAGALRSPTVARDCAVEAIGRRHRDATPSDGAIHVGDLTEAPRGDPAGVRPVTGRGPGRRIFSASVILAFAAGASACLAPPEVTDDDTSPQDDDVADDDTSPPDPDADPEVRIASPDDGSELAGAVEVVAEASDDFGIVEVVLYVDGVPLATLTTPPYAAGWDTCAAEAGEHQVSVTARDGAGQTASHAIGVRTLRDDFDGDAFVAACGDCDDARADVHPGAPEVCGDGVDGDCDGTARGCGFQGVVAATAASARLIGAAAGDLAGSAVAAGDLDGDGVSDVVVGAEAADTAGEGSGATYVVFGPVEGEVALGAAPSWYAGTSGAFAGDALAVGDIDDDGTADLLVGAYADDGSGADAGSVAWAVPGGPDGAWTALGLALGAAAGDFAGKDVALGDIDGDGVPEVVIGAHGADSGPAALAGRVHVVPALAFSAGPFLLGGDLEVLLLEGEAANDYAGVAVACGDLDGDGLDDVVVGAPHTGADGGAGRTYVVRGGRTGWISLASADARLDGLAPGDRTGFDVSTGGDVDGDGLVDLLVGAPYADPHGSSSGAAYLLAGSSWEETGLDAATASIEGAAAGDNAGWSVAIVPDVNGDGYDEVWVGVPSSDEGGPDAGAAWLYLGPVTGRLGPKDADARFIGTDDGDLLGISLSAVPNLDGHGRPALLAGGVWNDAAGDNAGAAWLFASGPGL
ncbi:Ig-like domain-containing protein [Myxococcota bacterium]|nr:Ig-like domain-containing protein [Myxococcota bacterium]